MSEPDSPPWEPEYRESATKALEDAEWESRGTGTEGLEGDSMGGEATEMNTEMGVEGGASWEEDRKDGRLDKEGEYQGSHARLQADPSHHQTDSPSSGPIGSHEPVSETEAVHAQSTGMSMAQWEKEEGQGVWQSYQTGGGQVPGGATARQVAHALRNATEPSARPGYLQRLAVAPPPRLLASSPGHAPPLAQSSTTSGHALHLQRTIPTASVAPASPNPTPPSITGGVVPANDKAAILLELLSGLVQAMEGDGHTPPVAYTTHELLARLAQVAQGPQVTSPHAPAPQGSRQGSINSSAGGRGPGLALAAVAARSAELPAALAALVERMQSAAHISPPPGVLPPSPPPTPTGSLVERVAQTVLADPASPSIPVQLPSATAQRVYQAPALEDEDLGAALRACQLLHVSAWADAGSRQIVPLCLGMQELLPQQVHALRGMLPLLPALRDQAVLRATWRVWRASMQATRQRRSRAAGHRSPGLSTAHPTAHPTAPQAQPTSTPVTVAQATSAPPTSAHTTSSALHRHLSSAQTSYAQTQPTAAMTLPNPLAPTSPTRHSPTSWPRSMSQPMSQPTSSPRSESMRRSEPAVHQRGGEGSPGVVSLAPSIPMALPLHPSHSQAWSAAPGTPLPSGIQLSPPQAWSAGVVVGPAAPPSPARSVAASAMGTASPSQAWPTAPSNTAAPSPMQAWLAATPNVVTAMPPSQAWCSAPSMVGTASPPQAQSTATSMVGTAPPSPSSPRAWLAAPSVVGAAWVPTVHNSSSTSHDPLELAVAAVAAAEQALVAGGGATSRGIDLWDTRGGARPRAGQGGGRVRRASAPNAGGGKEMTNHEYVTVQIVPQRLSPSLKSQSPGPSLKAHRHNSRTTTTVATSQPLNSPVRAITAQPPPLRKSLSHSRTKSSHRGVGDDVGGDVTSPLSSARTRSSARSSRSLKGVGDDGAVPPSKTRAKSSLRGLRPITTPTGDDVVSPPPRAQAVSEQAGAGDVHSQNHRSVRNDQGGVTIVPAKARSSLGRDRSVLNLAQQDARNKGDSRPGSARGHSIPRSPGKA